MKDIHTVESINQRENERDILNIFKIVVLIL